MCITSSHGMQQYIEPIVELHSSSCIVEFGQGDISQWFE